MASFSIQNVFPQRARDLSTDPFRRRGPLEADPSRRRGPLEADPSRRRVPFGNSPLSSGSPLQGLLRQALLPNKYYLAYYVWLLLRIYKFHCVPNSMQFLCQQNNRLRQRSTPMQPILMSCTDHAHSPSLTFFPDSSHPIWFCWTLCYVACETHRILSVVSRRRRNR